MPGPLANSPAQVMQYLLIQLELGTLPIAGTPTTWPVYESLEPDQPDNTVTLYDTEGILEGKTQVDGAQQSHYGFQVRVRATDKPTAYAQANAIAVTLDPVAGVTVVIGSHSYLVAAVTRKGDPIYMGAEKPQSARKVYTINAIVVLRQVS